MVTKLKSMVNHGKILLFDLPHFCSSDFFLQPIIEITDIISNISVISVARDVSAEEGDSKNSYENARIILDQALGDRIRPIYVCNGSLTMNPFQKEQIEYIMQEYSNGIEANIPGSDIPFHILHRVSRVKLSADDLSMLVTLFNPNDIGKLTSQDYSFFNMVRKSADGFKTDMLKKYAALRAYETKLGHKYSDIITLPVLDKDHYTDSPTDLLPLLDMHGKLYGKPIIVPQIRYESFGIPTNFGFGLDWQMLAKSHYFHSIGKIATEVLK